MLRLMGVYPIDPTKWPWGEVIYKMNTVLSNGGSHLLMRFLATRKTPWFEERVNTVGQRNGFHSSWNTEAAFFTELHHGIEEKLGSSNRHKHAST